MWSTVMPSIGTGALSAREAEGRTNTSAGEKVSIDDILVFFNYMFFHPFALPMKSCILENYIVLVFSNCQNC